MKLETAFTIIMMATSIWSGWTHNSFWWVLIPGFIAGSFSLANSRHYESVVQANLRGVLWYFPTMLAIHTAGKLVFAGLAYGVTVWLS